MSSFRKFAWFYLAYLLAVILFGAWVRISGSGNGCGSHWPMCNGEIIPQAPAAKTMIEFTHRLTSGLCGIFGLILLVWSRRVNPAVSRAAAAAMVFLIVEALVGALLVKKELVADDASTARAAVVALHLANTMLLTAATATAAWKAGNPPGITSAPRALLASAVFALVIVSMAGAVTALGDTLFPTRPTLGTGVFARVSGDLSAGRHFLVRLRIIHPVIASLSVFLVGGMFLTILWRGVSWVAIAGCAALMIQVMLGLVNIAMAAPGPIQLAHLLVAQLLWIFAWLSVISAWPKAERTAAFAPAALRTANGV